MSLISSNYLMIGSNILVTKKIVTCEIKTENTVIRTSHPTHQFSEGTRERRFLKLPIASMSSVLLHLHSNKEILCSSLHAYSIHPSYSFCCWTQRTENQHFIYGPLMSWSREDTLKCKNKWFHRKGDSMRNTLVMGCTFSSFNLHLIANCMIHGFFLEP